jgi:hypothetical protein
MASRFEYLDGRVEIAEDDTQTLAEYRVIVGYEHLHG